MTVKVLHGDCMVELPKLEANSVHATVCDPPYELNFMGKSWDGTGVAVQRETWTEVFRVMKPGAHLVAFGGTRTFHRMACAIEDAGFEIRDTLSWLYGSGFPKSHNLRGDWEGWGTALKPAWEPIILARKPIQGTVAANVLKHGAGGINVDACRVESEAPIPQFRGSRHYDDRPHEPIVQTGSHTLGRWPANVLHDGSDEVVGMFPETTSGTFSGHRNEPKTKGVYGSFAFQDERGHVGDSGSAARFFYAAKADADDRAWSKHPTVKPLSLMRWLCKLVTPPGGTILDCFAGSGTTLEAARCEGFNAIGIEREAEYIADINRRLGRASGDDTPLFAQVETAEMTTADNRQLSTEKTAENPGILEDAYSHELCRTTSDSNDLREKLSG